MQAGKQADRQIDRQVEAANGVSRMQPDKFYDSLGYLKLWETRASRLDCLRRHDFIMLLYTQVNRQTAREIDRRTDKGWQPAENVGRFHQSTMKLSNF